MWSGRKVEEFVAEEITGPLGADFHCTLQHPDDVARLSELQVAIGEPSSVTEMEERIQLAYHGVAALA